MSEQNRRKIIKSISIASGVFVGNTLLPKTWQKPVVNTILLPAHAQTTTGDMGADGERTVSCEIRGPGNILIAEGSLIPPGTSLTITFTVTPNPGVPLNGTALELCNGFGGLAKIVQTDANGQYIVNTESGFCGAGITESIFLHLDDLPPISCEWVHDPGQIVFE